MLLRMKYLKQCDITLTHYTVVHKSAASEAGKLRKEETRGVHKRNDWRVPDLCLFKR